jgi:hypothetical protein
MRESKYTSELLEPVVKISISLAEVIRRLGLRATGGNYRMIATRLRLLGISMDHFKGQGWAKGETAVTNPTIARLTAQKAIPDEEVFVENSPVMYGQRVIKRMLKMGWKYECAKCGLSEWRERPVSLQLDHLNGVCNDNRLENLRLLCPNCHSQTPTYCRRKRTLIE